MVPITDQDLCARQCALGLRDAAAAAELGTPVSTYRKWIRGTRRIPGAIIVLILALAFIRAKGLGEDWARYRAGKDGVS